MDGCLRLPYFIFLYHYIIITSNSSLFLYSSFSKILPSLQYSFSILSLTHLLQFSILFHLLPSSYFPTSIQCFSLYIILRYFFSQRLLALAQPLPPSSSLTISSISSHASSSIILSSTTFPPQHQSSSLLSSPKTSVSFLTSCKSTSSQICHSSATFSSQPNCPLSSISSRLNVQSVTLSSTSSYSYELFVYNVKRGSLFN